MSEVNSPMLPTGVGPAARLETERLHLCAARLEFVDVVREAIAASIVELRRTLPWARTIARPGEPDSERSMVAPFTEFCAMFDRGESFTYVAFERDAEAGEFRQRDQTARRAVGAASLKRTAAPDAFEIGYWIRSDCTSRGFATELAGALVRAAFDLHGARRIELSTAVDNPASARVAAKLGFVREATLRERHPNPDGTFADAHLHSLFRAEYPDTPAARLRLSALDATGMRIL